jgi:hypothetical protein
MLTTNLLLRLNLWQGTKPRLMILVPKQGKHFLQTKLVYYKNPMISTDLKNHNIIIQSQVFIMLFCTILMIYTLFLVLYRTSIFYCCEASSSAAVKNISQEKKSSKYLEKNTQSLLSEEEEKAFDCCSTSLYCYFCCTSTSTDPYWSILPLVEHW